MRPSATLAASGGAAGSATPMGRKRLRTLGSISSAGRGALVATGAAAGAALVGAALRFDVHPTAAVAAEIIRTRLSTPVMDPRLVCAESRCDVRARAVRAQSTVCRCRCNGSGPFRPCVDAIVLEPPPELHSRGRANTIGRSWPRGRAVHDTHHGRRHVGYWATEIRESYFARPRSEERRVGKEC